MLNLSNAKLGKFYVIKALNALAPLKIVRRLLELGLTSGQKIKVVRKSLTGQTILIEVRGYVLSMRSNIAKMVILGEGV